MRCSIAIRAAWRSLARAPGTTLVAVLTLALGVGANAAIFTLVNAVLWKQLPYRESERLVSVWSKRTDRDKAPLSLADYKDFQAGTDLFDDMAVFAAWGANLTGKGEIERLQGIRSTANIFFGCLAWAPFGAVRSCLRTICLIASTPLC